MRGWLLVLLSVTACTAPGDPDNYTAQAGYLDTESSEYRRQVLEASLWRPELPYARNFLNNYGLGNSGWDLLMLMKEQTAPFTLSDSEDIAAGRALTLSGEPVDGGVNPETAEQWRALGERVFYRLPMRHDPYLTWLAANPQHWDAVGIETNADGTVHGMVKFEDDEGVVRAGVTCGLCHGSDGASGRGNRKINLGLARSLYAGAQGQSADEFLTWGPGRVDVSEDDVNGPVAIPDLWGLAEAQYMNQSGVIQIQNEATLAMRFESQIILGHRMHTRPRRKLIWALTQFVLSLQPPQKTVVTTPEVVAGRELFEQRCASCHASEHAKAGGLIDAELLTSDPKVANTPERGTGYYKVPSLIRVADNGPFLHDGSEPTLDSLLAGGHPYGEAPAEEERQLIIAYLETL